MISNIRYWFLMLLVLLVYLSGMFVTLFENDSAQFATMAMRMFQENDYWNLFKGPEAYLDKPHMHYWLAALSFKIFGIHDWAYRIPAVLATFLGAYSCYGLGKLLYNKDTGKLAALIFITAQTIVLSAIDVRTDAVLTGFVIFAIWHLATYIETKQLGHMALGAFGAGIAFSTKGQIALVVILLPLICHIAYLRKWKVLLDWPILAGLVVFALVIAPMLYAYYLQFDLHPEQVIREKSGRSGIFFIFWEQSFERMSGEGMGANSSDYFFFFHTFLWVFLPWTILGLLAFWVKVKEFITLKFRRNANFELLTLGGITLIFVLISFAQFKLPHYLNSTIPLFSVLTGAYLYRLNLDNKKKKIRALLAGQYFILAVVFIASMLICYYVFKLEDPINYVWKVALVLIIIFYSLKQEKYYLKVVTITAISSILLNAILNLHFYPTLLQYQAGSEMAKEIKANGIPTDKIYKLSARYTWSLDFYNQRPAIISSLAGIQGKKDIWIYVTDMELMELGNSGYDWDRQFTKDQFRITRLQAKFLDPATRNKVLERMHLIHIL